MTIGIAGAGLLGRLLALQLSSKGHQVEVFDTARGPGPRETSGTEGAAWTAAGMLSPVAELDRGNEEVFRLGLRSCALWPGIAQAIGMPRVCHLDGSVLVAHRADAGAAQRLVGLLQAKADGQHQPEALTVEALASLEASVQGPTLAWLLPSEGYMEVHNTLHGMHAQATRQGVQWHWGCTVQAVQDGQLHTTQDGWSKAMRFEHVFDVRGVGARPQLPVRGVRGEIFLLHAPEVSLSRPLRLMHPRHSVYIVPRPDHCVVVGASCSVPRTVPSPRWPRRAFCTPKAICARRCPTTSRWWRRAQAARASTACTATAGSWPRHWWSRRCRSWRGDGGPDTGTGSACERPKPNHHGVQLA